MSIKEIRCKKCHKILDVNNNDKTIICDSCGEENQVTEETKEIAEMIGNGDYSEVKSISSILFISAILTVVSVLLVIVGSFYNYDNDDNSYVLEKDFRVTTTTTATVKDNNDAKEFNKMFLGFEGTYNGNVVYSLCAIIDENNAEEEYKIDLIIDGVIRNDSTSLEFDREALYDISYEYSSTGYINKVIINKKGELVNEEI